MPEVTVNYLAVLIGAVINMVVGFLWYGPLFGNQWMKLVGLNKKDAEKMMKNGGAAKVYGTSVVLALLMVYVLGHVLAVGGVSTVDQALEVSFWQWAGFIFSTHLIQHMYEQKPLTLTLINTGYYLVTLLLAAVVFVMM